MVDENILQNAIDFYQKIKGENEVTVKFRKINGAVRIMRCTLDFDKIPDNQKPKDVNMAKIFSLVQKHGMVHVYDLDKKDWRTVPFNTSEWLETPNHTRFRIKK